MSTYQDILDKMRTAVISADTDKAVDLAKEAIVMGVPIQIALAKGFAEGLRVVGDQFSRMELFLSDLYLSAAAMEAGVAILEEELAKTASAVVSKGTIVVGTVESDIHDIGKNIVVMFLRAAGYKVVDLGKDVSVIRFVDTAEEVNADIIGASCLLTSTLERQREIVDEVKTRNLEGKIAVIIGGAPTTQAWADEIGAKGFASNGSEAVRIVEDIIKQRRKLDHG